MFNQDTIKGKWQEIKGEVHKAWGKLTDDEIEKTKGDAMAISGLVQQKYGLAKEDFNKKFAEIVNRFEEKKDKASESAKDKLASSM